MNDQLAVILEQLASKLGVASEVLWQALLKQALVAAYLTIVGNVLLLIIGLVSGYLTYRSWIRYDETYEDSAALRAVLFGASCLIAIPISLVNLFTHSEWAGFFNPEYWALIEVLKHLK